MANIFEFLLKDENITPEKACKSRQMQFHVKTASKKLNETKQVGNILNLEHNL